MKKIIILALAGALWAMPLLAEETAKPALASFSFGENGKAEIHYLGQFQAVGMMADYKDVAGTVTRQNPPSGYFQLRRNRLMINGQLNPKIEFAAGFFADSFKDKGTAAVLAIDAFITCKPHSAFMLDMGSMLLPNVNTLKSAAKALGTGTSSKVQKPAFLSGDRDIGIEARGLLFEKEDKGNYWLEYRLGVFNGAALKLNTSTSNQQGLRYSGTIYVNLLNSDNGFGKTETHLSKKKILTLAASHDMQEYASALAGATAISSQTSFALIADIPLDKNAVNLWAGYQLLGNDFRLAKSYNSSMFGQVGFYIDALKLQPSFRYTMASPTISGTVTAWSENTMTFGLAYYIDGYNANVKVDFDLTGSSKTTGASTTTTTQSQLTAQFQINI